jgi:hypothetical protein
MELEQLSLQIASTSSQRHLDLSSAPHSGNPHDEVRLHWQVRQSIMNTRRVLELPLQGHILPLALWSAQSCPCTESGE